MDRLLAVILMLLVIAACATTSDEPVVTSYSAPSNALVLRVEVLQVEFTEVHPGCGDEKPCVPFYHWWNYRARVKEVVRGTWSSEEVAFAHLQHGKYISRATRDCYVVLVPASPELSAATGSRLMAERLVSKYFKGDKAVIRAIRAGA